MSGRSLWPEMAQDGNDPGERSPTVTEGLQSPTWRLWQQNSDCAGPWKKWRELSGQMAERAGIAGGAWTDVRGRNLFMEHWAVEHLEMRAEQAEQRSECEEWSGEHRGFCLQANVSHDHWCWLMEILYLREHPILVYWIWCTLNYG